MLTPEDVAEMTPQQRTSAFDWAMIDAFTIIENSASASQYSDQLLFLTHEIMGALEEEDN